MSGRRIRARWLSGFLLLLLGCGTTTDVVRKIWEPEPTLKPPPRPEEYTVPPVTDSRFSAPIEYPRGTLNTDLVKKKSTDPVNLPMGGASRFGAGPPGMGGY